MFVLQNLAVTFGVAALFGLLCGLLCRRVKNKIVAYAVFPIAAFFIGIAAASTLRMNYPVLFDHLSYGVTWTGWLPLNGPIFAYLSSCPWVMLLGFGTGFAACYAAHIYTERSPFIPLVACLAGFTMSWAYEAEHLPAGVYTVVDVYRFSDSQIPGWNEQSYEWVKFLERNCSPGLFYHSEGPDSYSYHGGEPRPKDIVFLFVKQYYRNGKPIGSSVRTEEVGPLTAAELKAHVFTIATARTGVPPRP